MNTRSLSILSRRIRPSPRSFASRAPIQRRFASSNRQPSNIAEFYKTFTRPVAKVLLMAVFTYQLAYWAWVKLEQDEIRSEREAEIASLERKAAQLSGFDPGAARRPAKPAEELTLEEAKVALMDLEKRYKKEMVKSQQDQGSGATKAQDLASEAKAPWWVRR